MRFAEDMPRMQSSFERQNKLRPSLSQINPRRILLIKPSALGDVVHALPVLSLMRRRWPEAHIAWLITPNCAGIVEGHPQLDEILLFRRGQFGLRKPRSLLNLLKFAGRLEEKHFDLAVDLQGLLRSGWMTWCSRAPVRVGFAESRELAWWFYTHRVADPLGQHNTSRSGQRHAVERYLDVAEALGCGRSPVQFILPSNEPDRAWLKRTVSALGPYAVLIPGTNWRTKRWPAERFAELAGRLRQQFQFKIIAAGAPNEFQLGRLTKPDLNLAGKTTIGQLIALLRNASLVIANDSGPMHIAAALGRPLVTLFGPTEPGLTGPYRRDDCVVRRQIGCSPCFSRRCSHQDCLRLLEIDPVIEAARQQLETCALHAL